MSNFTIDDTATKETSPNGYVTYTPASDWQSSSNTQLPNDNYVAADYQGFHQITSSDTAKAVVTFFGEFTNGAGASLTLLIMLY